MTLSFVVHVLQERTDQPGMVGRVEIVQTGEVRRWRSPEELIAILEEHALRPSATR